MNRKDKIDGLFLLLVFSSSVLGVFIVGGGRTLTERLLPGAAYVVVVVSSYALGIATGKSRNNY